MSGNNARNLSKRSRAWQGKIAADAVYPLDEALTLVKGNATAKFRESVDIAINLGIDAKKSDQVVRGSALLPHGTGKVVRVAVFAQGQNAEKALAAGADVVGFEDLAERMKGGEINFDTVIATPDAMRIVGQLGRVLGPRGLMPNPKVGTVTQDVETAVINAKAGQVRYRADKGGVVHCAIGKADFEVSALRENLLSLLADIKKVKPASSKGQYVKRLTVSSTMGPGVMVDQASLDL
ncbi:MAG: 50S ribosomal protein L1 [Gammaproteobacteria bacterium]